MNTNLAYIDALVAALRAEGVDVEDGKPGPWGSWSLELRYGWIEDSLEVWAFTADLAHAEQVAAVVAGMFRQRNEARMVAVCN